MVVVKQPGWTRVSHGSEVKRLWDKSEGHSFDTYREHSELFLFLSFCFVVPFLFVFMPVSLAD